MKDLIQKYLNCIPLNSEELYVRFWRHTMSYTKMKQNGFPLPDPKSPGRVLLVNTNVFSSKSMRLDSQMCRCGKIFSMLEDDWYVDDHGCNYHLGKQSFAGPNYGLYNCCKTVSPGCAFSKHHVSFHRPYEDVRFVHTVYKKSSAKKASNIFSIDCEMAFTTKGMEAVKVSLVDINGEVVYDTYVQPKNTILDYNTAFSGVCEKNLLSVTTRLDDVQARLLQLLNKDSILIGHGVENDLLALNMTHETVIDTSCVFPHKRGHPLKNSLKYLAEIYLQKNIQKGYTGHNSVEDARTCMELMLYKIYTETRTTFVPRPIIPGIIPKTFQSINQSYPKFAVVPFNIVHVMPPPTFICFHVNVSPPFSPFPRLQAIQMKSFYPGEESMAWKSALKKKNFLSRIHRC